MTRRNRSPFRNHRQVKGVPNKTEARYYKTFLFMTNAEFEGEEFRLAYRCHYTPDWIERDVDGNVAVAHEVKGGWVQDDARVKFKCASKIFPDVTFIWAQWKNKRWTIEKWKGGEKIQ